MRAILARLTCSVALWVVASGALAAPDRLQFSVGSIHTKDEDDKFSPFNPGLFLTWDRRSVSYSAGIFRNSYSDPAFALVATWAFWHPRDWELSAFGALAWYPNGSRFDLSIGNWVPGLGVEVRRGSYFAQIFPSSDDLLDAVVTFGVTVPFAQAAE